MSSGPVRSALQRRLQGRNRATRAVMVDAKAHATLLCSVWRTALYSRGERRPQAGLRRCRTWPRRRRRPRRAEAQDGQAGTQNSQIRLAATLIGAASSNPPQDTRGLSKGRSYGNSRHMTVWRGR